MRYRPLPSVTAVRTFSVSAGLAASTVTPGNTAPVVSLTSPARMACAAATRGTAATSPNNRKHLTIVRIVTSGVGGLFVVPSQRRDISAAVTPLSRVTEQVFNNLRG